MNLFDDYWMCESVRFFFIFWVRLIFWSYIKSICNCIIYIYKSQPAKVIKSPQSVIYFVNAIYRVAHLAFHIYRPLYVFSRGKPDAVARVGVCACASVCVCIRVTLASSWRYSRCACMYVSCTIFHQLRGIRSIVAMYIICNYNLCIYRYPNISIYTFTFVY